MNLPDIVASLRDAFVASTGKEPTHVRVDSKTLRDFLATSPLVHDPSITKNQFMGMELVEVEDGEISVSRVMGDEDGAFYTTKMGVEP